MSCAACGTSPSTAGGPGCGRCAAACGPASCPAGCSARRPPSSGSRCRSPWAAGPPAGFCGGCCWGWPWPPASQPLGRSLKNSCLLFLYGLPRSLGAAALLLGYAAGVALFAPLSYLVLILGNAWLPLAAALLMIYQPMERALGLEEQIRAAQASRRAKVAPAAPSQAAASKSSPSRRLAPNQNRSTIQG